MTRAGWRRLCLPAALALLACGADPSRARQLMVGRSCDSPGLARALVADGSHAWVTEEEQSRVHRFDLATCGVDLEWQLPAGPRAIALLPGGRFATADLSASVISIGLPDGGADALAAANSPGSLAAGDLDGDGKPELVVTFGLEATDAGWGTFATAPLASTRFEGLAGASAAGVADLDGDGTREVLIARSTEHRVTVFSGMAAGVDLDVCAEPFSLTALPMRGAVVTCRTGGLVLLDGAAASATMTPLKRDGTLYQTVAADLDGDGFTDLASVDPFAHRLVVWWGARSGYGAPAELAVPEGPVALATADVDADGDLDIVVLSLMAKKLTVVVNPWRGNTR